MKFISKFIKTPREIGWIIIFYACRWLPDKLYLRAMFWVLMGQRLNLKNPHSFSEKLQWLKLYNRKPEYTIMVDKVKAKEYVASVLGDDYIIPTLGVWDDPEKIDFNVLPDRFVIKCNHNSGTGMYICKDKSKMDVEKVKSGLRKGMQENYFRGNREWPYKNVPRRILAEKYIDHDPQTNDLPDYKFFCFNGEPLFCQVISGRSTKMCIDFFDKDWNHQPFHEPKSYPFAESIPQRPLHLDKMWEAAGKLAKDKPFVRIDFYDVEDSVYFGEITFFPTSGMGGFFPEYYDSLLGEMIDLPHNKIIDSI